MQIRRGKAEEINKIMRIYEQARAFMRKNGNATQWDKGYPSRELILKEIEQGCQYVCEEEEAIVAVFSLCGGPDPTYEKIWDGQWLNQSPYHVLHRLASSGERKGAGMFCLQWSIEQARKFEWIHMRRICLCSACWKRMDLSNVERSKWQTAQKESPFS